MTEYLRDLLYLDWEKAASIFSQLQGGLLKETQESAEKARERRAGLGLSIGPLRPELGGSAADRASVVETRVMHHDLLLTIEDALFRGGAAVDLSSYKTGEEARAAAEQYAYIRTEGWAAIEDNARIDHMSASFLDVVGMIRRSAKLALEDSPEVQDLRAKIEQERRSVDVGPKAQRSAAPPRAGLPVGVQSAALLMGVSSARASSSDCPAENWCIWTTKQYGATGGYMYAFNNGYGTNSWYDIHYYGVGGSVYNRRQNHTWFSWDIPPPNPAAGTKDCMIPGGGRGDLSTWWYPDGHNEFNLEDSIDLSTFGSCP